MCYGATGTPLLFNIIKPNFRLKNHAFEECYNTKKRALAPTSGDSLSEIIIQIEMQIKICTPTLYNRASKAMMKWVDAYRYASGLDVKNNAQLRFHALENTLSHRRVPLFLIRLDNNVLI
jgi:hypothetical protein